MSSRARDSMLTAMTILFAKILDEAEIDVILVGDSASNVMAVMILHFQLPLII